MHGGRARSASFCCPFQTLPRPGLWRDLGLRTSSRVAQTVSSRRTDPRACGRPSSSRTPTFVAMSGWDEGNVFFSDQGQGDPTRPAPEGITPGQARRTFADFFRNFRGAPTASSVCMMHDVVSACVCKVSHHDTYGFWRK